jgi:hypothetical protein
MHEYVQSGKGKVYYTLRSLEVVAHPSFSYMNRGKDVEGQEKKGE